MNIPKRKVVAYCGFEQSGKSYNCKRLVETMGFEQVAFADALREIAFKVTGFTFEDGMKRYEDLKKTQLINGLTFRNILENLGSAIRRYDKNFWANTAVVKIKETHKNVCVSDLRYKNEFVILKAFCDSNKIDFKLVFCDYKSSAYNDKNFHESTNLARYLKAIGYRDQDIVRPEDILAYMGD